MITERAHLQLNPGCIHDPRGRGGAHAGEPDVGHRGWPGRTSTASAGAGPGDQCPSPHTGATTIGFCTALDCRRVSSALSCCHPARRVNIFGVHRIRQGSVCMPLLLVCCCMKVCVGLTGKCDKSNAVPSARQNPEGQGQCLPVVVLCLLFANMPSCANLPPYPSLCLYTPWLCAPLSLLRCPCSCTSTSLCTRASPS
jgi:hypothetical protein